MRKFFKTAAEQNHLLAAVPERELAELASHLEPVTLAKGETLYQPGRVLSHVYFPTSAIVNLHHATEAGNTVGILTVGDTGLVGEWLYLGGSRMPSTAEVYRAGEAWRLSGHLLRQEFARGATLSRILLRYTQTLLTRLTLTISCNSLHSLEQRLSGWLLGRHNLSTLGKIPLTQEDLANRLGVRREAVTLAMGNLQRGGLIKVQRGSVTVINSTGLAAAACECNLHQYEERTALLADLARYKSAGTGRVTNTDPRSPQLPVSH